MYITLTHYPPKEGDEEEVTKHPEVDDMWIMWNTFLGLAKHGEGDTRISHFFPIRGIKEWVVEVGKEEYEKSKAEAEKQKRQTEGWPPDLQLPPGA